MGFFQRYGFLGCPDDKLPWGKEASSRLDTKYMYVCHAEMNAILNKNSADVENCSIYVALFPCNECAKMIIQSGIKESGKTVCHAVLFILFAS
jgi:dCMP deaminase